MYKSWCGVGFLLSAVCLQSIFSPAISLVASQQWSSGHTPRAALASSFLLAAHSYLVLDTDLLKESYMPGG